MEIVTEEADSFRNKNNEEAAAVAEQSAVLSKQRAEKLAVLEEREKAADEVCGLGGGLNKYLVSTK